MLISIADPTDEDLKVTYSYVVSIVVIVVVIVYLGVDNVASCVNLALRTKNLTPVTPKRHVGPSRTHPGPFIRSHSKETRTGPCRLRLTGWLRATEADGRQR